jgi:hypothetical protein
MCIRLQVNFHHPSSDLLNMCNPYANRNFGLNMTQLQIFIFFELNASLTNCIDSKQKSSAPDKNTSHCLDNKHIRQCEELGNFPTRTGRN